MSNNYRAEIDGLRALSIIGVVGFHTYPVIFGGGFLGVDIFFVISGYLISKNIYKNLQEGKFSFVDFYCRRIRRIFPSLIVMLLACLIVGHFVFLKEEYKNLAKEVIASTYFASNYLYASQSGYFDHAAYAKPLLNLWSLSVEEQFYTLFPILVLILWRRKFFFYFLLIILTISSFLNFQNNFDINSSRTFYLIQFRFWEISFGSILALQEFSNKNFKFNNIISATGIVIIFYCFYSPKIISNHGINNVLAILGATLIIISGVKNILLNNGLMIFLGLISYPLYLWHWPIISFISIVDGGEPSNRIKIFIIFVSLLLAWLSYRYIELPFKKLNNKCTLIVGITSIIVILVLSIYIHNSIEFKIRNSDYNNHLIEYKYQEKFYYNENAKSSYPEFSGFYAIKTGTGDSSVMVLGDSYANRLIMGLDKLTDENYLQLSDGGCPGLLGLAVLESNQKRAADKCSDYADYSIKVLEKSNNIKTVLIMFLGPRYTDPSRTFLISNLNPELKDQSKILELSIRETFNRIARLNKRVIFIYSNPEFRLDPLRCLDLRPIRFFSAPNNSSCETPKADYDKSQKTYRLIVTKILKDYPEILLFDTAPIFCNELNCTGIKDGKLLYIGDNHISLSGSLLIAKEISPILKQ